MNGKWVESPLVASYIIGDVLAGQVVRQSGISGKEPTWATFDLINLKDDTGPKLIADGYKSVTEARRAMEQYWAEREQCRW